MAAKFTDRELRLQALMLDDPYDQPDLIWKIKDDARLLDVLNIYNFKEWPQRKAYCVACEGHHHKKGFTCITSDGDRMMFGSTCGADAFGESWVAAEQRMKERVSRQGELVLLDRMKPILGPIKKAMRTWVRPIEVLAYRRIGFSEAMPELYRRCHEAAQRANGMLTVFKRVRMKLGNEPDWVEQPFAVLPGHVMFSGFDRHNIVHIVENAEKAITILESSMNDTQSFTNSGLKRNRMNMERAFAALVEAAEIYEGAQEFFTPYTYQLLANWSQARDVITERYHYERGMLLHEDTNKRLVQLEPLSDLNTDLVDLIKEYKRAD